MLIVQKFGGTSVAGVEAVRRVAGILADTVRSGASVAAVLSAQGDTTDELLTTAAKYNPNPSPRELDMLLSTGEQASVALMAMALEDMGLPVVSLTGWQAGMGTDAAHGAARLRRLSPGRVQRELEAGKIVLIAGFQGLSPQGDITTLGRGGSDTTAAAVAAALGADVCRIYTDVDGVYTADPRSVEATVKLDAVDIDEMLRLSAAGARVLHVRSVALARRFHVPLEVLSSMADVPGTRILPLPLPEDEGRITALAADGTNVTLVGTHMDALPFSPGQRAADALSRAGIGVAAMVETDGLLSVRPEEGRESEALRCLHKEFFE